MLRIDKHVGINLARVSSQPRNAKRDRGYWLTVFAHGSHAAPCDDGRKDMEESVCLQPYAAGMPSSGGLESFVGKTRQ